MSRKIIYCPFCGKHEGIPTYWRTEDGGNVKAIFCNSCRAVGPVDYSQHQDYSEAIRAWSSRPPVVRIADIPAMLLILALVIGSSLFAEKTVGLWVVILIWPTLITSYVFLINRKLY